MISTPVLPTDSGGHEKAHRVAQAWQDPGSASGRLQPCFKSEQRPELLRVIDLALQVLFSPVGHVIPIQPLPQSGVGREHAFMQDPTPGATKPVRKWHRKTLFLPVEHHPRNDVGEGLSQEVLERPSPAEVPGWKVRRPIAVSNTPAPSQAEETVRSNVPARSQAAATAPRPHLSPTAFRLAQRMAPDTTR